jgi:hypothetical protein
VGTFLPIVRLGPNARLYLRADKAWLFRTWMLSLSGELFNVTNHNNRRFSGLGFSPSTGQFVLFTDGGVPITRALG